MADEPLLHLDERHVWNFWQNEEAVNEVVILFFYDFQPYIPTFFHFYTLPVLDTPETHTFHLPSGEATIMLKDVSYLLGLPVEGYPITGKAQDNWFLLDRELLGVDPVDLDDDRVNITWLDQNFSNLPTNASTVIKEQFAPAHILRVIGGILMPDKSRNKVHLMWLRHLRDFSEAEKFSWGSTVLAYLFRDLCKATDPGKHAIGGCLLLLQSWAWFRMPFLRPTLQQPTPYVFPLIRRWSSPLTHVGLPDCQRNFRLLIDKIDEFLWTLDNDPDISTCVPLEIFQGAHVWMSTVPLINYAVVESTVPLINYAVVEWHPVDRVMRQFHCVQLISDRPINLDSLHRITRQGKTNVNWKSHHSMWIMQWADRYSRRPDCQPIETYFVTYGYFDWFVASGKPHILTPAERQREIYARPQNRPPSHHSRRAQPPSPRRRRGNNTRESSSAPPQPQPHVPDQSTPIAPHAISSFQHMGVHLKDFSLILSVPICRCLGPPLQHHIIRLLICHHYRWQRILISGVGPSQAIGTATADDDEDDESTEDEEIIPRRNPARTRNPPRCGTGGHRHH
ncbi:hypothetical protein GQ457_02G033310 [Hibiscus cannabinus]